MAQVIKEVTKELQDENDRKMGKQRTIEPIERIPKPDRHCFPWKKGDKYAEKIREEMEKNDDEDEDEPSKKKDMYELARKWKAAKNGKGSTKKKYACSTICKVVN